MIKKKHLHTTAYTNSSMLKMAATIDYVHNCVRR